ncbi:MAG: hypothetical protein HYT76_03105 [Deltaproteobacteria bacterium]|nr:hypothetical protein [Deltaproteobacteria bacterium]
MMTDSIEKLASRFLDATVNKWGVDDKEVCSVLKSVHDWPGGPDDWDLTYNHNEFNRELYKQMTPQQAHTFRSSQSQIVPAILRSELSGSALARAEDLYDIGRETYRASGSEYFLEGVLSCFDLSSLSQKVAWGGYLFFLGCRTLLGGKPFGERLILTITTLPIIFGLYILGFGYSRDDDLFDKCHLAIRNEKFVYVECREDITQYERGWGLGIALIGALWIATYYIPSMRIRRKPPSVGAAPRDFGGGKVVDLMPVIRARRGG